jgi:hypothetical protein
MGESVFEILEETLDRFTPGGKDCESDQDKEDALKKGKKEPENAEYNENPADDQNSDFLEPVHRIAVCQYRESRLPAALPAKGDGSILLGLGPEIIQDLKPCGLII